ncbi:MAG: DUF4920 domain-containing protein [Alphaproteobacteria bacterium]|nr:DUF4920 domain-containing protein [Alphaproteobacteria bacterium]
MTLLLLGLLACDSQPAATPEPPAVEAPAPEAPAPEAAQADWTEHGAAFTVDEVLPASALLDDPAAFVDKTVRVEGRVAEVCQKKGCWMVLAEGDKSMRVLMKDHAFSVPKDGAGGHCQVEGRVTVRELDAEWVEHLASESEDAEAMPEKQAQDNKVYELEASGVRMHKAG